jgi:NitT/TauT family transport system substrate-binding protein
MEGGTRGIQVLLSGEIQVMHVGIAPVIQANAEDAAITIVAASINTIPLALFAQAKFKAGADLKGANIGISTFGSESDIAVSLALKALGVAKQDVTINQLGGSSQRLAALLAGRADAVPLPEPQNALARQKGYTPLIDLAAQKTPWMYDALVVQKSALANTADLERFLKAYIEGVHLGYSDPALVKAVIAKQFKTNDAVVIDATYAEYKRLTPLDTMPSEAGARNAIEQLTAIGIAVKSKDVGNYIDTGPLKRVLADTAWRDTLKSYKVD